MSHGRFLERWSRLKKTAEKLSTAEVPDAESLLDNLTPESDFGQFLRQEISEEVRRKAMKTLFADPHFNVMDGLDIYIDDYSVSEPIPEAMLSQLWAQFEPVPVTAAAAPASLADCDNLTGDGQNVPEVLPQDLPVIKNQ